MCKIFDFLTAVNMTIAFVTFCLADGGKVKEEYVESRR